VLPISRRLVLLSVLLVAARAAAGTLEVTVTAEAGGPLADAVVYAMPTGEASKYRPTSISIRQREQAFHPLVTAIPTGTAIAFPNEDTVRHHVYSFSPAKVFELRLYVGTPRDPIVFDKPGVVVLGCNIHDKMIAYVVVVDTLHIAKSDARGIATFSELPDGRYRFHAWHPGVLQPTTLPPAFAEVRIPVDTGIATQLKLNAPAPSAAAGIHAH
jgi:plastocyanin